MIKLKVGPYVSIGVKDMKKMPKEGVEIVKYIEDQLDGAINEVAESFNLDNIREALKTSIRSHFCKIGEWPKYVASKLVVTHDLNVHKRNVEKFNNLTDKKWNEI